MQKAYKIIDLSVDRQAYFLAYQDTFRVVGVFFLAVLPLVYFIQTKKKSAAPSAAAQKAMEDAH